LACRPMRHIALVAATAGSLALALPAVATDWEVEWPSPQTLSTPPPDLVGPLNGDVARSPAESTAIAVWAQSQGSAKFQVWSAITDDAGSTWAAPAALSADNINAESPALAVSEDGQRATVVWFLDNQAVRSASTADGGSTWLKKTVA